ncbi:amphoterin-induced protein 1 [Spea bombifrons]|uniref:amphoterin-induced protein 1 n=1 Tax=Spea bombifrons TaxID=233779 RepID=UPI00234A0B2E|nr:amphoterin-induced protein 1 [Spea bombifrons]
MRSPFALWLQHLWTFSLCLLWVAVTRAGTLPLNCQNNCICASDIISCPKKELVVVPSGIPSYTAMLDLSHNNLVRLRAEWTPVPLKRLHTLLLSHNYITFVSADAFILTPHLRHLDLSSNKLYKLEENAFSALKQLEVLILFKNSIADIDRSAFDEMKHLQKLYLSQNHLTHFPGELVNNREILPELTLLDLSFNQIKRLPVSQLTTLPAWLSNGLYLHGNPLTCNCDMYGLFWSWQVRQLSPIVDFRDELRCNYFSKDKVEAVNIFSLSGIKDLNCSAVTEAGMEVYLGDTVTLNCDTKHRGMTQVWITPGNEIIQMELNEHVKNHSISVLNNGSLQIYPVRIEDRGIYTCYAQGNVPNETLYVTLNVFNFTRHVHQETLNTAYTTLVGCVASVILVLIYLYLTPCRCWCRPRDRVQGEDRDSIRSSVLSATPNHETTSDKAALSRHVAFLEPSGDLRGQNGKLKPNGSQETAGIKGSPFPPSSPHRKLSDPGSISSVFSDTPIVV